MNAHITKFWIFLVLLFASGCVSQDTTKLHVGMTKEEVIKVMGNPDTVGNDGQNEYLNYHIVHQTTSYNSSYHSSFSTTSTPPLRDLNGRPDLTVPNARPNFTPTNTAPLEPGQIRVTETERYVVVLKDSKVVSYGTKQQLKKNL